MPIISPFGGYLVAPARVADVVAPSYDSLSPEERFRFAAAHPDNFLNVMRSREEFPPEERPTLLEVLELNAAKLQQLLDEGAFQPSHGKYLYLYRMATDEHVQTGVVAEMPIAEYDGGRIRKHEHTQPIKEDELTRYQKAVGASSSPVSLAYARDARIDECVERLTRSEPLLDFAVPDRLRQTIWRVENDTDIRLLVDLFAAIPVSYLTDGHHRTAAASRFAAERRKSPAHRGDEAYNYMLVALFPHNQLRILAYNRCVRDIEGYSVPRFLSALEESFEVTPLEVARAEDATPTRPGELAMLLDGDWYRLQVRPGLVPADPVRALDVVVLEERVLSPILGISDARSDARLDYVAGTTGLRGLAERCRQRDWRLGFACFPTSIEQLIAVADAGEVMPPKSTWFEPKARSGVFLRIRNRET